MFRVNHADERETTTGLEAATGLRLVITKNRDAIGREESGGLPPAFPRRASRRLGPAAAGATSPRPRN